jgi:hypothetical protein
MPTPEQLGLAPVRPAAAVADTDWAAVHRRLDRLGATCFHLEKATGGTRITCLLPTAQAGRSHRVEAQAASEGDAVRLALDQAEEWARQK